MDYGPVIDFPGVGWTEEQALSIWDANLDNGAIFEQYLGMVRAQDYWVATADGMIVADPGQLATLGGARMTLSVGDTIPDVTMMALADDGPRPVQSAEVLGKGKVVLFAVPGAFTPTCSEQHLPGFLARADDIKAKGVDVVACLSVNDAFVMDAWAKDQNIDGELTMLADGNGDFTAAVGLEMDGTGFGLGTRSKRYAAILQDGVVQALMVEPAGGLNVSSAEEVLAKL